MSTTDPQQAPRRRKPHPLAVRSDELTEEVLMQLPVAAHKYAEAERARAQAQEPQQVVGVVASPQAKAFYAARKATPKGQPVTGDGFAHFQLLGSGMDGIPCLMPVDVYAATRGKDRPKVGMAVTAVLQPELSGGGPGEHRLCGYRVLAMRQLTDEECPKALESVIEEVCEQSKTKQANFHTLAREKERKALRKILNRFPEGLTVDELVGKVREQGSEALEEKVQGYTEAIELMVSEGQLEEREVDRDGKKVTVLVPVTPASAGPAATEPDESGEPASPSEEDEEAQADAQA